MRRDVPFIFLLSAVFTLMVTGCGGSEPPDQPASTPTQTEPTKEQTTASLQEEPDEIFWNDASTMYGELPKCVGEFGFSHPIVNPEDLTPISFGPGSHVAPHAHMAYWGTFDLDIEPTPGHKQQLTQKVQLYAPTDIVFVEMRKHTNYDEGGAVFVEWGGSLRTCDGHILEVGHLADPSDEMKAALAKEESECEEGTCRWAFPAFIAAGTPLFKSSGFSGGFDFGLTLAGLTANELQKEPGYGFSITPWRSPSGTAVCPIDYFPEPFRSAYRDLMVDFECGPFNQDVPGTAMGFWLPSPSPDRVPLLPSERGVDEWETIWLYQDPFQTDTYSMHAISVGNDTFGLDYGKYGYSFVPEGSINLRWDLIVPGRTYCAELRESTDLQTFSESAVAILVAELSEDGKALTVEATPVSTCGEGPWVFLGGERTFYR